MRHLGKRIGSAAQQIILIAAYMLGNPRRQNIKSKERLVRSKTIPTRIFQSRQSTALKPLPISLTEEMGCGTYVCHPETCKIYI